MWLEISVGVIALSILFSAVFLIIYFIKIKKTIERANELVLNLNRLTIDVQEKVMILGTLLKPLSDLQRKFSAKFFERSSIEKISEILETVAQGIQLFGKIKEEFKEYVKSK